MAAAMPVQNIDQCPVHNDRKVTPEQPQPPQRIEVGDDGTWHVHGYEEARQILRPEMVRRAVFMSKMVMKHTSSFLKTPPILFLEGEEHHRQRRETNKFFT